MTRLIVIVLLLTACNPLHPQPLPLPDIPESFSIATEIPGISINEHWWTELRDPQLNQLQSRMFTANLDLAQALQRLEQLQAMEQATAANRWPNLALNGSLTRDGSPSASGTVTTTSSRLSVAAGYELDLWNKLKDKRRAAELRTQAGEKDVQTLLLSLSAQLTEQYIVAIEQQQQLTLLDRQINRNEALLKTVTERYMAGLAATTDLYRAQKELIALKSQRPQHQTNLAKAQNLIAIMIGQAPGANLVETASLPQLSPISNIGLPADLLTRRPDVAAALISLAATDHELAAALADRLPAINLSATLGRTITHLVSGDIEGTFWNLTLGLTQPLIDGGRREAESKRQAAIRAEKLAHTQKTILLAMEEVESALIAENNSAVQAQLLEQQQQINLRNLQLTADNYLSGLASSDALLDQEIAHLEILSQQLSQQRQWLSQRISLARALGGGWMAKELEQQRMTQTEDQPDE